MSETKTTKKSSAAKTERKTPTKTSKKAEDPKQPRFLRGIVDNCKQLNIRAIASTSGTIIGILNRGESVIIDPEKTEGEFYCIKLKGSKLGFCMKKYIKIP